MELSGASTAAARSCAAASRALSRPAAACTGVRGQHPVHQPALHARGGGRSARRVPDSLRAGRAAVDPQGGVGWAAWLARLAAPGDWCWGEGWHSCFLPTFCRIAAPSTSGLSCWQPGAAMQERLPAPAHLTVARRGHTARGFVWRWTRKRMDARMHMTHPPPCRCRHRQHGLRACAQPDAERGRAVHRRHGEGVAAMGAAQARAPGGRSVPYAWGGSALWQLRLRAAGAWRLLLAGV
jgi:hypothetical protein